MTEQLELLGITKNENYLTCPIFCIINGKSNSGKSHCLRWIMREINESKYPYHYGVVFTNTKFEGFFDKFMPANRVVENYDVGIIDKILNTQKKIIEKRKNKKSDKCARAFIILDDCLSQDELRSNKIEMLAVQARHYCIDVFLTTQYPNMISPVIRSNATISLMFDIGSSRPALEALYNSYGQRFSDYNNFKEYYYRAIKDHKFICCVEGHFEKFRVPEKIPDFFIKFNLELGKK
jgi:hypothetical protein